MRSGYMCMYIYIYIFLSFSLLCGILVVGNNKSGLVGQSADVSLGSIRRWPSNCFPVSRRDGTRKMGGWS